MRYSREYFDRLSGTTGVPPAGLERVVRLERFLGQVTAHPFLGSRLVLKGGTALNLFYAAASRLSVDLDFNIGLSGILPRPLTDYDASRLHLDQRQIDRELQPLLRGDARPDAEDLVRLVGGLVSSLTNLSADEKRYVDELQWGEFHPQLVTAGDSDLAHRLERHPALLWKLENARKRVRR